MKTNITLSVDKELVEKLRLLKINLSHFFESTAITMFDEKDMYIEVTRKGNKIYQEVVYLNRNAVEKEDDRGEQ